MAELPAQMNFPCAEKRPDLFILFVMPKKIPGLYYKIRGNYDYTKNSAILPPLPVDLFYTEPIYL